MSYNHTSNSVNAPPCKYTTLQNYNGFDNPSIHNGNMDQPDFSPPTNVIGKYIVPLYEPISYDALTGGKNPSCGGYFNISSYGHDGGNGTTNPFKCGTMFAERLANGRV